MSRALVTFDRVMAFVVGAVLIVVGAAAILWWRGTIAAWPTRLHAGNALQVTSRQWWPWVMALAGVILILLGLRWMTAHLPRSGVTQVKLPGSARHGRLLAQVRPVTKTAAQVLEATPGIRSTNAAIRRERGELIARLNATIEPQADLRLVADAADRISRDLREVLERDDLHCQVRLRVAARGRSLPRVR